MNPATQVTEITPELCDTLRAEIDAALKSVGQAHGVTLELGRITYGPAKATTRLTVMLAGVSPYADGFEQYAPCYGLQPADLGLEVKINGETYTILGLKPRATKRPVVLRRADGEIYNFPAEMVREALGRKPMTDDEHRHAFVSRTIINVAGR